jgi:hypothetical protein
MRPARIVRASRTDRLAAASGFHVIAAEIKPRHG